ncbi:MAG: 2-hydroxyhepta-2,4-diene-1,7-dioate isomerase [Verrucomicrobiales bacterium]|nr:2-hydroxyhepta-2,4-diene-1,7-dioate isomerase [Verrucomicrobiales bacterium]
MPFRIYRTATSVLIESHEAPDIFREAPKDFCFNSLFNSEEPAGCVASAYESGSKTNALDFSSLMAPIRDQEIWAAGVTYFRSRTARMEEAETAGGDIFYDKVYDADRPELFFKATAPRTRGHGDKVAIRSDSSWDVPEPELTLAINKHGKIFGHTIGNDMSSRSIEGENPLYLPQAKVYTGSCAIGPCLLIDDVPEPDTKIAIEITRGGDAVFSGETKLSQLKRSFEELAEFLFRSNDFANGAYLMTGTGIVPESDFSLKVNDVISITIEGIGILQNEVEIV